ncbi:hypothetical protein, partial [Mesorhizobium sp. M4B.F.Ca.ET.019.03.1.1]|uniref:hypothetical protein n=1 Tax=Mesorhizobium sp. M4B.F.Ca.ET.019.03.1.1 TaxID=2496651 RepID=UPI001AECCDD7
SRLEMAVSPSLRLPAHRIPSQPNFKSQKAICDSPAHKGEIGSFDPGAFSATSAIGESRRDI